MGVINGYVNVPVTKGLTKRGNMFPETFVARVCFSNVSQFCHPGSIFSKKPNLLLLHGRNFSCFRAAWKHGKTRKQLWKQVTSMFLETCLLVLPGL